MWALSEGFKVADAYISVHTDDDTRKGRDAIERDSTRWASALGFKLSGLLGMPLFKTLGAAMTMALQGLFQVSKWLLIAAAISAAAQALGAVGVALGQLVGLAPLVLPGILALGSAFAAIKISVSGVGDAVKQAWSGADPAKLAEAMKKLAPPAQQFVLALVKLKPAMEAFKMSVQGAFFHGLATDLQVLASVYLPLLQTHLTGVAAIFNTLAHNVIVFFTAKDVIRDWTVTFSAVRGVLSNITSGFVGILDGLRHIGTVATPILQQLTSGFGAWANHFAELMKSFRDSGQLASFIQRGITAFGQLWDLLTNIWLIIKPVFTLLSGANNIILQQLIALTGQFAAFLSSADTARVVAGLLSTLGGVLKAIGPGVLAVLSGLGAALVQLEPALTILGQSLGAGLVALAPALAVAGLAIAQILTSLAPILPMLAQFVTNVVAVAAPVLAALAPVITRAFQDLFTILTPLLPILGQIAMIAADMLSQFEDLAAGALGEVLPAIAQAFLWMAQAVQVLLPPFMRFVQQGIRDLVPLAMDLLRVLLPIALLFGKALLDALVRLWPVLLPFIEQLAQFLVPVLTDLAPLLVQLALSFGDVLVAALIQLLPFFEQLLPLLVDMLHEILPYLPGLVKSLIDLMVALLPLIGPILLLFLKLCIVVLPVFIPLLQGAIQLLTWLTNTFKDIIGPVASFVGWLISLTDRALDLQGIFGAVMLAWNKFKDGLKEWWSNTIKDWKDQWEGMKELFRRLPATVGEAVGDLKDTLVGAGKDLVRGLWNGVASMKDTLTRNIKGFIHDTIPGAVQQLLGIKSPSTVMAALGKWVPAGLAGGIRGNLGVVRDAASQLADAAMPALGSQAAPVAPSGVAGASGADPSGLRDIWILADFGDGVKQVVKAVIARNPDMVAATTAEGRRQRGFTNTARPAS